MLLDSTIVRAHVSAAGAPQKKEAEPTLGRNRGGFGTQIPSWRIYGAVPCACA